LRKFKFPILLRLITPFSTIFSLSFICIAYTFNQHLDADIDLSFVPEIAYAVEDTAKESVTKLTSSASYFKSNLDSYKDTLISKYNTIHDKHDIQAPTYPDKSKNIYDFTIDRPFGKFAYFSQHDPRWKDTSFGSGGSIEVYGCGPTTLSMIVANILDPEFTPDKAAELMFNKGLYIPGAGSSHAIIPKGLAKFGIKSYSFNKYSPEAITGELQKGNMFVALMKNGVFSSSTGHFIILLGIDRHGKVIIADSNSVANSKKTWDSDTILSEAKYSSSSGGPFWLVESSSAN